MDFLGIFFLRFQKGFSSLSDRLPGGAYTGVYSAEMDYPIEWNARLFDNSTYI